MQHHVRESTLGPSRFPHFTAEEAAPLSIGVSCPQSHREGAADTGREAESPRASRCPRPLTSQPGLPGCSNPRTSYLPGLAKPSRSRYPTSVTGEAENEGRGPQVPEWGLGDTVNAGAQLRSFPSPSRTPHPPTVSPRLLPWAPRPSSDRQVPRFPSPMLTLQALSAPEPRLCLQQASSRQTATQPNRWRSSTRCPLCSHNHIWGGQALTPMSSCQWPSTRPTRSTAVDPRLEPASGHREPNQTPAVKYHPCPWVYADENP